MIRVTGISPATRGRIAGPILVPGGPARWRRASCPNERTAPRGAKYREDWWRRRGEPRASDRVNKPFTIVPLPRESRLPSDDLLLPSARVDKQKLSDRH